MAKTSIHPCAPKPARLLLLVLAAGLAVPPVSSALATPQSAPLVFMNMTRRDFGDLFAGEEIEQVFPIRNDGDAPLEMENKSLTGQAAPAFSDWRASAFQASGTALRPVALRRTAPS